MRSLYKCTFLKSLIDDLLVLVILFFGLILTSCVAFHPEEGSGGGSGGSGFFEVPVVKPQTVISYPTTTITVRTPRIVSVGEPVTTYPVSLMTTTVTTGTTHITRVDRTPTLTTTIDSVTTVDAIYQALPATIDWTVGLYSTGSLGFTINKFINEINATPAYAHGFFGQGVTIAFMDDGFRYLRSTTANSTTYTNHPQFNDSSGNSRIRNDLYYAISDGIRERAGFPASESGLEAVGIAAGGVITATSGASPGHYGVAISANIMPIDAVRTPGGAFLAAWNDHNYAVAGVTAAVGRGAKIISWGLYNSMSQITLKVEYNSTTYTTPVPFVAGVMEEVHFIPTSPGPGTDSFLRESQYAVSLLTPLDNAVSTRDVVLVAATGYNAFFHDNNNWNSVNGTMSLTDASNTSTTISMPIGDFISSVVLDEVIASVFYSTSQNTTVTANASFADLNTIFGDGNLPHGFLQAALSYDGSVLPSSFSNLKNKSILVAGVNDSTVIVGPGCSAGARNFCVSVPIPTNVTVPVSTPRYGSGTRVTTMITQTITSNVAGDVRAEVSLSTITSTFAPSNVQAVVAGALAVIQSRAPSFPVAVARWALLNNTDDIGASGVDNVYGRGLINVGKAISVVGDTRIDYPRGSRTESISYRVMTVTTRTNYTLGDKITTITNTVVTPSTVVMTVTMTSYRYDVSTMTVISTITTTRRIPIPTQTTSSHLVVESSIALARGFRNLRQRAQGISMAVDMTGDGYYFDTTFQKMLYDDRIHKRSMELGFAAADMYASSRQDIGGVGLRKHRNGALLDFGFKRKQGLLSYSLCPSCRSSVWDEYRLDYQPLPFFADTERKFQGGWSFGKHIDAFVVLGMNAENRVDKYTQYGVNWKGVELGPWELVGSYSRIQEQPGYILGSQFYEGFAVGESTSNQLGLRAQRYIEGWRLYGGVDYGRTQVDTFNQSLISSVDGLSYAGWRLGLDKDSVFRSRDKIHFGIAKLPSVISGSMSFLLLQTTGETAYDEDMGMDYLNKAEFKNNTLDLKDSNTFLYRLGYRMYINRRQRLGLGFEHYADKINRDNTALSAQYRFEF